MESGRTDDEFPQSLPSDLNIGAIATVMGGQLVGERNTPKAITIREHGEKIDSLEKEIKKKDDEIVALQKVLQTLQEQNDELKSALDTKDEEIGTLKSRIDELEDEKTELQRELGSVKTDLSLVQKQVDKLRKAKSSQEQTNLKLKQDLEGFRRTLETVKEDREKKRKESEELKKELRNIKESQLKGLLPLMSGARALPNKPLPAIPKTSGEALLHLGEMCRQIQTKLYRFVFPRSVKDVNYKVDAIHRHLSKFPNLNAQRKWESIQERFRWDETHEEAITLLQETRNIEAHPEISKDSLQRAISITAQSNNLEDNWLSTKLLHELLKIWETDLSQ